MTTIAVIGGTGYAGSAIVAHAASRGISVRILSRSAPVEADGVTSFTGSALDPARVKEVVAGSDAVIGALSPRGELEGRLAEAYANIIDAAREASIPFVVVGGFSALRPAPGAPRFSEGDGVPAAFVGEAREVAALLPVLEASDIDWVFVSPAAEYGSYAPGEETGSYQLGGDVAVLDESGSSRISGADFAAGIVDIVRNGEHHRTHLSLYN